MKKLIKCPPLLNGESLSSYVYRLSEDNYYESVFTFLKIINVPFSHWESNMLDEESCMRLSRLIDYNADELYQVSVNHFVKNTDSTLHKVGMLKQYVKYCPACKRYSKAKGAGYLRIYLSMSCSFYIRNISIFSTVSLTMRETVRNRNK
ncbi:hypothetical protein JOC77_002788 [Peribacillus deserti]|uniref:TniQ domain-containing protein n=1 Tax=Peribacillus deserti TaxID=673318 RepID=A0ABS2QJK1_9BACI|nr:TniQ family protein [Peribacillus deserti]MBM7693348.1 hypothetical protein [Peribacillus deserti]